MLKQKTDIPRTEGIKYAGSKAKIIPYILSTIDEITIKSVLDGFSGTTRVSQAFAQVGLDVTSSDLAPWSEVFGKTYLLNRKSPDYFQKIIDELNSLPGKDGWFTEHYGGDHKLSSKKPFQKKNTRKLDSIRERIDLLDLSPTDKAVILTSLIRALDSVDSTIGHYAAYLREWSKRSYNDLYLKVPSLLKTPGDHKVIRDDIFNVLEGSREYDLAYFDPPYGSNNEKMPPSRVRYSAYYHIWSTVVLNDKPETFGKAGRREDSRDAVAGSVFEEFRKDKDGDYIAMKAIQKMIELTKAKYLLLSYSSGGRATKSQLLSSISNAGNLVKFTEIDHKKNVMATMRWTDEWVSKDDTNKEYLFLLKK